MRPLLWILAASIAILLLEQTGYPHYLSPATAILVAITLEGLRYSRQYRPEGRPVGATMVRWLPACLLLIIVARVAGMPLLPIVQHANFTSWCCSLPGHYQREHLEASLAAGNERHVLIVRYHETQYSTNEWVYNHPDIDDGAVVWARDMGAQNQELRTYYPSRHLWLVEPDEKPVRVTDCRTHAAACGLLP